MNLRQSRVADQIRDILASRFYGDQIDDPRLKNVCITRVKVTADLQLASVYYRTLDDKQIEFGSKGLESCKNRFRKLLAQELIARRVPSLRFFYDESVDDVNRVETILSQINQNQ